jgi:hypothetical protein
MDIFFVSGHCGREEDAAHSAHLYGVQDNNITVTITIVTNKTTRS